MFSQASCPGSSDRTHGAGRSVQTKIFMRERGSVSLAAPITWLLTSGEGQARRSPIRRSKRAVAIYAAPEASDFVASGNQCGKDESQMRVALVAALLFGRQSSHPRADQLAALQA